MATYPHIEQYRKDLEQIVAIGGSMNELTIKPAFRKCLAAYCHEHRERLLLLDELPVQGGLRPDGTVRDKWMMDRGYWEAKDIHDDLDAEIEAKFARGYPRDNIIFEDSKTAVLYQNDERMMWADMSRPGDLHRLIGQFLAYELPEIEEFRQAQQQFKTNLQSVLESLRATIEDAERHIAQYQRASADFLDLCHQSIGPDVSEGDVREMLLQHILTKDIFLSIFSERQFHSENNIARQLDNLEQTFFVGDVKRQALDKILRYYDVISAAALRISDYEEKQSFLKAIYEDFYKAYNPSTANRLGVVYTPNEIVDFIIRGADFLLHKHFGRGLADENVQILDPATGTGTFITNLIEYLPQDKLEYKYLNEMHANEVAILPYYIANLNIEYTYRAKTERYLEFPNLVFVDTLDNMDWQGATGGAVQRQGTFELGRFSQENLRRVQFQNAKTISVIIGNPPYNSGATVWGDGAANRTYPEIDRRISETYIAESTAQKTKQFDMYKRFIRWASDRLADDGIVAFVSNSAFLDARQDDGFRKVVAEEFNELWVVDLKGNARTSGERRRQEGGNIFEDKIRVGVAIYFLVRHQSADGFKLFYNVVEDYAKAPEKTDYIRGKTLPEFDFRDITPDKNHNWLNQSSSDFEGLIPIADKTTKFAKTSNDEQAVFKLIAPGVNTARDEWVYDFDRNNLRNKALYFADIYNELLENNNSSYPTDIKWSRDLRNKFRRKRRIVYNEANRVRTLYRPFVIKHHIADDIMNDVLTRNHYAMFGENLSQFNRVINFCVNRRHFYAIAADNLTDWHFTGDTQCLPLYRYTAVGERVNNITDWGLRRINEHYRREFGERFEETVGGESITAEDVFAYTYAVLHDPVYRHDYAVDLLREFPRLPLYHDFDIWVKMGSELLDLHLNFESVEPYSLDRLELQDSSSTKNVPTPKPIMTADKERGCIRVDERTTLTGVPENAWRYLLGSNSALEWILDQYSERKSDESRIAPKFGEFRLSDYKEEVIDLLRRVCTVSVRTMDVVDDMAYWEDGKLTVFGDRDKFEMATASMSQWFSQPEDGDWEAAWSEM